MSLSYCGHPHIVMDEEGKHFCIICGMRIKIEEIDED